jgi:hypothetical protein
VVQHDRGDGERAEAVERGEIGVGGAIAVDVSEDM